MIKIYPLGQLDSMGGGTHLPNPDAVKSLGALVGVIEGVYAIGKFVTPPFIRSKK